MVTLASDYLAIVNDTFSSQRQSNSAAAAVTKSSNVQDQNESQHTTTSAATNGHESDSGALDDFINLKMTATRQTFISVR